MPVIEEVGRSGFEVFGTAGDVFESLFWVMAMFAEAFAGGLLAALQPDKSRADNAKIVGILIVSPVGFFALLTGPQAQPNIPDLRRCPAQAMVVPMP